MTTAIVLLIVVLGSVVFNMLSPWWFTEIASNWGNIDFAVFVTFWICGIAFVLVGLFMVYAVWKYRRREGQRAAYEPENKRLEWILTVVTTVGVVGMLAPGLIVWEEYVDVPDEAAQVEIVGQQWSWSYRLPGEDGLLGAADARRITADNPFGLDPDDPTSLDDVLIAQATLHLPIDRPVKALLRSKDVLHDFYVPEFRAKMDAVPGMVTFFWFEPTKIGDYEILCAELCGSNHYAMRGTVKIVSQEDFDAWLAAQPTWAQMQAGVTPKAYSALARRGREVAETNGCLACHSLDGSQVVGPTWQGLWGAEKKLADGSSVTVDESYVVESVRQPTAKMVEGFAPVMIAYDAEIISDDDLAAVVAFLREETELDEEPAL